MDTQTTKPLEAYQKGDDLGGHKISSIVGRNNTFMVCTIALPQGIGVYWLTHETYTFTERQRSYLAAFNERYDLVKKIFAGDAGQVEALASALYQGLCSQNQDPSSTFKAIDTRISAAREDATSRTRTVYGVAATVTTIVLSPMLFFIASLEISSGRLLGDVTPAALLVCAGFGAIGALASALQKLRQVEVSYYPGFLTATFGGCSRIILGSIFGVAALLAARAGLFLQTLLVVPGGDLLIGFGAGVSERLVPELLKSIESRGPSGHRDPDQ
jgi:hypothetical protein